MAATRRSNIACARINCDLLNSVSCLGKDNHEACESAIPLESREFAYFIVGQGAHLFSDNGELRGILLEAANLLFCDEEHRQDSNEVVKKWLASWKHREKTDLTIRNLVHKRARDRGPYNEKWQAAFENIIGQIIRSDIPDREKLEGVKNAIHDDEFQHEKAVHRHWSAINKLSLRIRVPEPHEYQQPNTPPTQVQQAGAPILPSTSSPSTMTAFGGMTITAGPSNPSTSQRLPFSEAPLDNQVSEPDETRSRSTSITSSITRAIARRFHRLAGATESVAPLPPPPPPSRSENVGPTTGQPRMTRYVMPGSENLQAMPVEPARAPRVVCNICMHHLDRNNIRDLWLCQACNQDAHMTCFQEWKITNMSVGKRTSCPFCRIVVPE